MRIRSIVENRPGGRAVWSLVTIAVLAATVARLGPPAAGVTPLSGGGLLPAGLGCVTRIPRAVETVREERRRTERERNAFERFAREVRELDAASGREPRPASVTRTLPSGATHTAGETTDTVCSLYRETVMSTAHYAEEYDETLLENLGVELCPDLATAIRTNDALDAPLQRALTRAGRRAARERAEFRSRIDAELDSVTSAGTRLRDAAGTAERLHDADLDRLSFDQLGDTMRDLERAESDCEVLVRCRQTEYTEEPVEDGTKLREYLYDHHGWTHPVVGDALEVIRRVRAAKRQVLETVADN